MAGRVGAGAEKKFWKMPELVTKLVSFLDGQSTLVLAQAHQLTLEVVQQPFVWNKVVRRTCPDSKNLQNLQIQILFAMNEDKMKPLLAILDMSKGAHEMKLTLLEVICERFPPYLDEEEIMTETVEVSFSCPNQPVSPLGFLLLEEVELASGFPPNLKVANASLAVLKEPLLTALSRRVSGEQEQSNNVQISLRGSVVCGTTEEVHAFADIATSCKFTSSATVVVGDIGGEGWAALGKVAETYGGLGSAFKIFCVRRFLVGAKREDLRKLWESVQSWTVMVNGPETELLHMEDFDKDEGEDGWERLVKLLERSPEEINQRLQGQKSRLSFMDN